jgi:hypothetical protein
VPPLSNVTSFTPTKSNLCIDMSFATVMSEPALYRLLIFPVKSDVQFPYLRLFFQRISPGLRPIVTFHSKITFYSEELLAPHQPPSWRTAHCQPPRLAYSVYSQWPSISAGHLLHPKSGTHSTYPHQNIMITQGIDMIHWPERLLVYLWHAT